jgi:class 3 adenylate cyclase
MALSATTDAQLSPQNVRELETNLRKLWNLGANLIVGWRTLPQGIEVLYIPSYNLPLIAKSRPDILRSDRHITDQSEYDALIELGCRKEVLGMMFVIREKGAEIDEVNEIIRNFTVTHFESRAVALFDIVSFSVYSPYEQITQLSILSYNIKLVAQRCRSLNMPISICMTTTGDGFYVWNRHEGLSADIALFCVVVLTLGNIYASRKLVDRDITSVPRLRCGIHFGSHYEYYEGGRGGAGAAGYIVGDVTIILARLLSKARTGQFLIGNYLRRLVGKDAEWQELLGTDELDTPMFLALAQNQAAKLAGLPLPGGKIESVRVHLTGPRVSNDTLSIRKYYVSDKHDLEHSCYNAMLNINTVAKEKISFGLLDEDLEKFDARSDENEDIIIKVR